MVEGRRRAPTMAFQYCLGLLGTKKEKKRWGWLARASHVLFKWRQAGAFVGSGKEGKSIGPNPRNRKEREKKRRMGGLGMWAPGLH